ncbi:MAG: hypothetical protein WAT71_09735 [Ignavibacteria bacterium]
MKKNLPVSNNKDNIAGSGNSPEKINRKKFFRFTGLAAAGIAAASVIPFGLFKSGSDNKSSKPISKIKIVSNPNAVKRNSKESNNRNS